MPLGALVLGVGVDVVAVQRFAASIERTPGLRNRLFSAAEQITSSGHPRSVTSLAARFAVKEAVAKALGVPRGMDWHHCAVVSADNGKPELVTVDTVAAAATDAGVRGWRISMSHDAGIAAAVVIALG